MVFGSSLLLMALLLSGGQPILPEDQPIVPSVKNTAAAKSEAGSPAPCPDDRTKYSCGCKNECYEYKGKHKLWRCEIRVEKSKDIQFCLYENHELGIIEADRNGLCHY